MAYEQRSSEVLIRISYRNSYCVRKLGNGRKHSHSPTGMLNCCAQAYEVERAHDLSRSLEVCGPQRMTATRRAVDVIRCKIVGRGKRVVVAAYVRRIGG